MTLLGGRGRGVFTARSPHTRPVPEGEAALEQQGGVFVSRKDKNWFESFWAEASRKREMDSEEAGNRWLEAGHGCNPGGSARSPG